MERVFIGPPERFRLAAQAAQRTTAAAVAHILQLDLDPVRRLEQNLWSSVPHRPPRSDAMLAESHHELIRVESLHAKADVRAKCLGPVSFDERDELRAGTNSKERAGPAD